MTDDAKPTRPKGSGGRTTRAASAKAPSPARPSARKPRTTAPAGSGTAAETSPAGSGTQRAAAPDMGGGDGAAPQAAATNGRSRAYQKPEYAGLRRRYHDEVVPALSREFGYANPMEIPRVDKVVVNIGLGEAIANAKALDAAVGDLATITGQKPIVTRAKKSIANFKLREGVPIGAKVTLRAARMYEFFDRLVNVALPRVRDFKGVPPKGFDGRGNYALGLREQLIFPEIVYDKIDKVRGMDIIFVTTARTDEDAKALLTHLGMPFREQ